MARKPEVISVAAARRRARKLQLEVAHAEARREGAEQVIERQRAQIGALSKEAVEFRNRLFDLITCFDSYAADTKVIADVLRAYGAEDAEAKLRTISNGCTLRSSAILDRIGAPVDTCMAVTTRDQERR